MSSQAAKKNTEVNKDIIDKLQAMSDLYGKTNGTQIYHREFLHLSSSDR